jgi:hypothetical protein
MEQVAELSLSTDHRRAIGMRLAAMAELAGTLRTLGLDEQLISQLERAIDETRVATAAFRPSAPPGRLPATIAQLLIAAAEIGPRHLTRYGELDDEAKRKLTDHSQRLTGIVDALSDSAGARSTS